MGLRSEQVSPETPTCTMLIVATGMDVSVRKRMRQTPVMVELQGRVEPSAESAKEAAKGRKEGSTGL